METEIGGEKAKIPFSTYDLFGYLIPGATGLLAVLLFEVWGRSHITGQHQFHAPLYTAILFSVNAINGQNWVVIAIFAVALIIIAYVAGHIVSSLSSLFIDRIIVDKGYGYPFKTLLQVRNDAPKVKWISRPYYRGMFFWINVYLLLRFADTIYGMPHCGAIANGIALYAICGITAVKLLISQTLFEKIWLCVHGGITTADAGSSAQVRREGPAMGGSSAKRGVRLLLMLENKGQILFAIVSSGLYDIFTQALSKFIHTRNSLQHDLVMQYRDYFTANFGIDPINAETENYWLCNCFVTSRSAEFGAMLTNWLHLYSYARNLATAFYAAFIYCFVSLFLQHVHLGIAPGNMAIEDFYILAWLPLMFFVLAFVMLARYYYLYFNYYSKFLFRAFIFLNRLEAIK